MIDFYHTKSALQLALLSGMTLGEAQELQAELEKISFYPPIAVPMLQYSLPSLQHPFVHFQQSPFQQSLPQFHYAQSPGQPSQYPQPPHQQSLHQFQYAQQRVEQSQPSLQPPQPTQHQSRPLQSQRRQPQPQQPQEVTVQQPKRQNVDKGPTESNVKKSLWRKEEIKKRTEFIYQWICAHIKEHNDSPHKSQIHRAVREGFDANCTSSQIELSLKKLVKAGKIEVAPWTCLISLPKQEDVATLALEKTAPPILINRRNVMKIESILNPEVTSPRSNLRFDK